VPPGVHTALLFTLTLLLAGCYSLSWVESRDPQPAPAAVVALFASTDGVVTLELLDPNDDYQFDTAEKDPDYARDPDLLRFRRAELRLLDKMPANTVLVDARFFDGVGNVARLEKVDLLRLVPKLDLEGEMQLPELFLEEYTRYSVSFRREHREFSLEAADPRAQAPFDRVHRMVLANNCLDPGKWEMALQTEDFGDFQQRLESPLSLNQTRVLAHSWLQLDSNFYFTLLKVKNPHLEIDPSKLFDYDAMSAEAEEVVVDLDQLRRLKREEGSKLLEVAHLSNAPLDAMNREQYYKWDFGLFLNRDQFQTYSDLLTKPVKLARYADRGFYDPTHPKEFLYDWVKPLDRVTVQSIDSKRGGTFVEITIDGEDSPYQFKVGNVDLALFNEQQHFQVAFGFNLYPTSRRHTPSQATTHFDQDQMPDDVKPYLVMIDKRTGRWVNHQKMGLDRILIGWESIDHDILRVCLVSYERIVPVFLARLQLNDELVDRARVRRSLYS
jgi:hypothetical protein